MNRHSGLLRPVWAEISLNAIRHNLSEVRRLVGDEVTIMAVVKAEAYGHGSLEVAKTVLQAGASWLGVSMPEEGILLRKSGITAPILVFTPLQSGQAEAAVRYDLTSTACLMEALAALSREATRAGKRAPIHVKLDTGMGRVGIGSLDAVRFVAQAAQLPNIAVDGIYSHLATADAADKKYAFLQIKRFQTAIAALGQAGLLPGHIHLANSAAIIDLPESHFNMVRPGIMLYGLRPSAAVNLTPVDLQPALALKAKIGFIKKVPAGTGISYGLKYYTNQAATIATIPIGYADGWSRLLSNKAQALVNGKNYPVVGTICMDQCMIDLGGDGADIGQEVVLIGRQGEARITADQIAEQLGTINYEITCMISERVPRLYEKYAP